MIQLSSGVWIAGGCPPRWRLPAALVDARLTAELAVLLSRSHTGALATSPTTHATSAPPGLTTSRVHAAYGETMPAAWLRRFPTLRNLRRPPGERRTATHFFARREGGLASHVGLFQQRFDHERGHFAGGFIEDVATAPGLLGRGLASELMGLAVQAAREAATPVPGLATASPTSMNASAG